MKPVEWRPQARRDAADAAYWHARQGGLSFGEDFLSEVQATLDIIAEHPAAGSTRHAEHAADLPTPLRFLPLNAPIADVICCDAPDLAFDIDTPEDVAIAVARGWLDPLSLTGARAEGRGQDG